jgi:hypothetical protein
METPLSAKYDLDRDKNAPTCSKPNLVGGFNHLEKY